MIAPRASVFVPALFVAVACGTPPKPVTPPTLPGTDERPTTPAPTAADPDAWQARGELIMLPAIAPLPPLALPKVTRFSLSNGLPVMIVPQPKAPVVNFQLAVRAGRRYEPRAQLGIAELSSNLLVKGTMRNNAAALVKAIESVAGTIAVDVTYEGAFASCSVLARSVTTCTSLLGEIVALPTFPAKEFDEMRASLISGVKNRARNPRQWASLHVQNLLWTDSHVRGWAETEDTLAALTRDDVVKWHKTWYTPGNAMLVVAGDVDPGALRRQLELAFLPWRKAPTAPAPKLVVSPIPETRVRLVDSPGAPSTQIRIALRGITHDDPRFFESLVWNHALGAGPGARLSRALRAAKASSTTAESSFDRNADQGSIVISSAVRSSEALAATQLLLNEVAKLAKDGPTASEVAAAIAAISGNYLTRFDTAADVSSSLVGAELHGFGEEYLNNFGVRLAQVTAQTAKEAAAELLDLDRAVVVLVGDAKDLEPQLNKLGWRFTKVKAVDPMSAPVATASAVTPAQVAQAQKLLDAAVRAKGGEARLRAIKALHLVAAGQTAIDGAQMSLTVNRWFSLPDKLRIDVEIDPPGDPPPATIQVGVDGDVGWQRSPEGIQDIPADALASIEFERWREPELVLLEAKAPGIALAPAPDVVIDNRPHVAVRASSSVGVDVTLVFDKQTMLLRRTMYTIAEEANVDDFTDYRDVRGIKVAHKRVSTAGGRATTITVSKVDFAPTIDPSLFKKP